MDLKEIIHELAQHIVLEIKKELVQSLERQLMTYSKTLISVIRQPLPIDPELEKDIPLDPQMLEEYELEAIRRALLGTEGNRTRACALLGINTKTLYNRLKKLGLRVNSKGELKPCD